MTDFAEVEKSGRLLSRTSLGALTLESLAKNPALQDEAIFGIPVAASENFSAPIFLIILFVLAKFSLLSTQYHFGQVVSASSSDAHALSQSGQPQAAVGARQEMPWYNRRVIDSLENDIMKSSTITRFAQNALFFITFTGPTLLAVAALIFSFDSFVSFSWKFP